MATPPSRQTNLGHRHPQPHRLRVLQRRRLFPLGLVPAIPQTFSRRRELHHRQERFSQRLVLRASAPRHRHGRHHRPRQRAATTWTVHFRTSPSHITGKAILRLAIVGSSGSHRPSRRRRQRPNPPATGSPADCPYNATINRDGIGRILDRKRPHLRRLHDAHRPQHIGIDRPRRRSNQRHRIRLSPPRTRRPLILRIVPKKNASPQGYDPRQQSGGSLLTQISYYTHDPTDPRYQAHSGLIAWGVILIVIGAFAALFALLIVIGNLIASTMSSFPAPPGQTQQPAGAVLNDLGSMYSSLAMLIWTGIGSCLARRWVRPIIIIATLVCIASGILRSRLYAVISAIAIAATTGFSSFNPTSCCSKLPLIPSAAIYSGTFRFHQPNRCNHLPCCRHDHLPQA